MSTDSKGMLKSAVRGAYDIQQLRIQTGLRLVANMKVKLGIEPGTKEDESDSKAKQILKKLRQDFERITDGAFLVSRRAKFPEDAIISNFTELSLVAQYFSLLEVEVKHFKNIDKCLDGFPIWTEYLKGVNGVGPAMGGVIISEIHIEKAKYPSSLWAYAGLDVAKDGRGRSRRKEHLVDSTYTDSEGKEKTKKGITFNPFLKTKLMGVLAASFIKLGVPGTFTKKGVPRPGSKYTVVYYDYKARLENHAVYGVQNDEARKAEFKKKGQKYAPKAHRNNMAMRYCVKIFLVDLYKAWRKLEGLPVSEPYSEAKLGRLPHSA